MSRFRVTGNSIKVSLQNSVSFHRCESCDPEVPADSRPRTPRRLGSLTSNEFMAVLAFEPRLALLTNELWDGETKYE